MNQQNILINRLSNDQMTSLLQYFMIGPKKPKKVKIRKLELAVRSLNLQRKP